MQLLMQQLPLPALGVLELRAYQVCLQSAIHTAVRLLLLSCLAEMHSSSLAHQESLPSCLHHPHLLSMHAFTWKQPVFSTAEGS